MSRRSDVFLAFAAGAAVGAAVGILFAPDKGTNTREKLSKYLEIYKDKLKTLIEEYTLQEQTAATSGENTNSGEESQIITQAKSDGMKVVKDARSQAEALLGDVEDLIDKIKSRKS